MKIEIDRLKVQNSGNLIAYVDVIVGACVIIKGCRVLSGTNGKFISVPSKKNERDGKYYNHVMFTSRDISDEFNKKVIELVDEKMVDPAPQSVSRPEDIAWEE
jgi:DNA-binding cell septation regulator SpoVG